MSHIINEEKDIKYISSLVDILRSKGCNKNTIEEILYSLIPSNHNIKVEVGDFDKSAYFNITSETVKISYEKLKEFAMDISMLLSSVSSNLNNNEAFYYYYVLEILAHEVEHVYQYLIGNKSIDYKYKTIAELYKNLFTIEVRDRNPIYFNLKKKRFINEVIRKEDNFLLERNANIESNSLLMSLANYENNIELKDHFETQMLHYLNSGYEIYNGAAKESYKKLWIYSLFKNLPKDEFIPTEDKIRYGLPVDTETRKKILRREYFKQQ